jgi:hypothetical protein
LNYVLFHNAFIGDIAFPSKYLDLMLECAYLVETSYPPNPGDLYQLDRVDPLVTQGFRSLTPAQMRLAVGNHHRSRDVYVTTLKFGRSLAIPVRMMPQIARSSYVFVLRYPIDEDKNSDKELLKIGTQLVTDVKSLSDVMFEIHTLTDLQACQAQTILARK